jgi:hypothetical protein
VIRGDQRRSEDIRGHQRTSEAIRGDQRRSEVIRGDQRRSEAIRGHQRTSEDIRGHQRTSEDIRGHQRTSVVIGPHLQQGHCGRFGGHVAANVGQQHNQSGLTQVRRLSRHVGPRDDLPCRIRQLGVAIRRRKSGVSVTCKLVACVMATSLGVRGWPGSANRSRSGWRQRWRTKGAACAILGRQNGPLPPPLCTKTAKDSITSTRATDSPGERGAHTR